MREEIAKSMFDYLLKVSNGQLQLNPVQLEKVIGISSKQQSVLRKNKEFPIKSKQIGKLYFYSIPDVIEYLLDGKSQVKEDKKDAVFEVVKKRNNKNIVNVSSIFMMKSFASALEEESRELMQLSENIEKYSRSFELFTKLNEKLK